MRTILKVWTIGKSVFIRIHGTTYTELIYTLVSARLQISRNTNSAILTTDTYVIMITITMNVKTDSITINKKKQVIITITLE